MLVNVLFDGLLQFPSAAEHPAALTEKQLRRGVFRSTRELEQAIEQYIDQHNAASKPFIWTKTADQLLATIARFCHRIHNSGH